VAANGGNAASFDHFRTTVYYNPAEADAEAAAESVARLFGDAETEEAPATLAMETMLAVVVGKTFHGTLGPAPRDETPEHKPPKVVRDRASAAELLRPVRRKIDFPVLVPTVREASSSPAEEDGVRLYKLEDGKALRLTYETGVGDYWGIQQTSWTDAPILKGPTLTRDIDGRQYRLYFNGPKLHMVAFEENGAVYWVVNTLLNRMSNETMLAIAQGLKPLRAT
jgi:LytR cell envelope-related transcriptional attenuator